MSSELFRQEGLWLLRGFGQVMLQESALTGAFFLLGVCAGSWLMALGGVLGALVGGITPRLLGWGTDDVAKGWYGFNGALVGIALFNFFAPGIWCLVLLVVGSVLSSILMRVMLRWAHVVPPYTAPFILATWAMLMLGNGLDLKVASLGGELLRQGEIFAIFRSVAQVMFQDFWLAGLLFVVGLAVHSRQAMGWALVGALGGLIVARSLGFPADLAMLGVYGFNAVLVGIALGEKFRGDVLMPLVGIVLSTLLLRVFQVAGLPALTAPFVLASWAMILLLPLVQRRAIAVK